MAYGLTTEEVMWTALSVWATFQPRQAVPRVSDGHVFYLEEASHAFEKYCDRPEFGGKSECSQYCIIQYSLYDRLFSGPFEDGIPGSVQAIGGSGRWRRPDRRDGCGFPAAPDTGRLRLLGGSHTMCDHRVRWLRAQLSSENILT
jgi:hypothetical protein